MDLEAVSPISEGMISRLVDELLLRPRGLFVRKSVNFCNIWTLTRFSSYRKEMKDVIMESSQSESL